VGRGVGHQPLFAAPGGIINEVGPLHHGLTLPGRRSAPITPKRGSFGEGG
jgi:hypothetical protein